MSSTRRWERAATGELLRELAGDHTIVVIEHDMAFLRRFARKVTVVHEGGFLHLTTSQNPDVVARRSGRADDSAIDEVLDIVPAQKSVRNRSAGLLSGGQAQQAV